MITNVEKRGKLKSGGAIWIRMCECNFKNSNSKTFFIERGKIKRIRAYI